MKDVGLCALKPIIFLLGICCGVVDADCYYNYYYGYYYCTYYNGSGLIAGIIVGSLIGAALFISCVVFICCQICKKSKSPGVVVQPQTNVSYIHTAHTGYIHQPQVVATTYAFSAPQPVPPPTYPGGNQMYGNQVMPGQPSPAYPPPNQNASSSSDLPPPQYAENIINGPPPTEKH